MKSNRTILTVLFSIVTIVNLIDATARFAKSSESGFQPHRLMDSQRNRIDVFKKWLGNAVSGQASSPYNVLHPTHQFKGACVYCCRASRDHFAFVGYHLVSTEIALFIVGEFECLFFPSGRTCSS
jgi:hypothetical protein